MFVIFHLISIKSLHFFASNFPKYSKTLRERLKHLGRKSSLEGGQIWPQTNKSNIQVPVVNQARPICSWFNISLSTIVGGLSLGGRTILGRMLLSQPYIFVGVITKLVQGSAGLLGILLTLPLLPLRVFVMFSLVLT